MKEFFIKASDGLNLYVALFEVDNPKGLVQVIHGMKETKEKYLDFISFLNSIGLTVIASDIRGHGKSISDSVPLGFMDGNSQLIDDQYIISRYIKEKYPNKDLYMFGHSLGSMIARCYLNEHDDQIKKLILSGTVTHRKIVNFGLILGNIIIKFSGKKGYNNLLQNLGDVSKDVSWLCANPEYLNSIRNNPNKKEYKYTNSSIVTIWQCVKGISKNFNCKNPQLQILSVTGQDDKVTLGEKGLNSSLKFLKCDGYSNIKSIVYPNMKHNILFEIDKDTVYNDIKKFLL